MPADDVPERLVEKMADQTWRLNNLYWIKDENGNRIKFRLNRAQRRLLKRMHYRNVILKARQLGFSTFILLFILDVALFNSNQAAGVIADTKEKAQDLFDNKVKYAFDNLPPEIQEARKPSQDSVRKLSFPNGSSITVGTSLRSGTYQMLHVSELGKIAARFPDKAREIQTGAFETVPQAGLIFVESTAEGREGLFYDLVNGSRAIQQQELNLQPLDFKFHFFPWHEDPGNKADPEGVIIHPPLREYFRRLEAEHGIKLTREQRAWYALKRGGRTGHGGLGDEMMKREHPSHPDEAFEQAIIGAYFKKQFQYLREQGRITSVPVETALPVHTAWDLGMDDSMPIWFFQVHGREIRLVDYYENEGEGLEHYAGVLAEKAEERGWRYGRHYAPHDIEVRELGTGVSRKKIAADNGIHFETVPRVPNEQEGVEATRKILPLCWIDSEHCGDGILALENYRKAWDERRGTFRDKPHHDWASHGAKAFETLARSDIFASRRLPASRRAPNPKGWT